MLSPKPGVSTMVRLTRVPSSSSSSSTVMGLMRTPSSSCAVVGSSESRCSMTDRPHSVLTKVVRPVPEAPQTIKQNWIPFFTFFLRLSLMAPGMDDMVEMCGWCVGWGGGGVGEEWRNQGRRR